MTEFEISDHGPIAALYRNIVSLQHCNDLGKQLLTGGNVVTDEHGC